MKAFDLPPLAIWRGDREVAALLSRSLSDLATAGRLAAGAARGSNTTDLEGDLSDCLKDARATTAELLETAATRVHTRPRGRVVAAATAAMTATQSAASAAERLRAVAPFGAEQATALGGVLRDACRALDGSDPLPEVLRLKQEVRRFRDPPRAALTEPRAALRWHDATLATGRCLRACQTTATELILLRDE